MPAQLPQHVALIMDGNRRWARQNGLPIIEGHRRGLQRLREVIEECVVQKIPYLTLWAFSTENWNRSKSEVNLLMGLFQEYLENHVDELHQKGIKLVHIGRKDRLSQRIRDLFDQAEQLTANNSELTLHICVDYGGRDEILRAVYKACKEGKTDWTEADFSILLDTAGTPDPDFVIRSSGEQRLSGFMLWQCAYSELYFTDTCFPDFTVDAFQKALEEFSSRNRTHGS